jgi:peptidoglycan/xylan/chitin deacetylase (PgdA/CDA1 family)
LRKVVVAFTVVAAFGAVSLASASPAAAASPTTIVSLTFDHGLVSQYQVGALLHEHGVRATFFVNSGHVGTDPGYYMSWEQLQNLYADGNEIGGHTLTHADPSGLTVDQQRDEVCIDRANLLQHGFAAQSFAYPYGADSIAQAIVQGCGYNSARLIDSLRRDGCARCPYAERIPPTNQYATRASDEVRASTSLADLKEYVTQAESHGGGWVQLVFGNVCANCNQQHAISPGNMDELLEWLEHRDNRGTVVQTVRQVIGGTVQPAPVLGGVIPVGIARDTIRPVIMSFSLIRRAFAVGRKPTPLATRKRRGTVFRYTVSEPGQIRIKIQRRVRSCPRKVFRSAKRARCFRYRTVGTLVRPITRLVNKTKFSGRLGKKVLRAGRYSALAQARDVAGNRSKSRRTYFKIVRTRR